MYTSGFLLNLYNEINFQENVMHPWVPDTSVL